MIELPPCTLPMVWKAVNMSMKARPRRKTLMFLLVEAAVVTLVSILPLPGVLLWATHGRKTR